ncbi:unnamed protein product [Cercopithifilaria johnstoni]|uniref:Uncharacterized protein n=1 Tax=Cercopithifilaria johnstoni TaxID=2874296 RepID=A0A8J2M7K7_9BILA|nr:unnamed protein product [Cercopithifilaria johnstoni]
MDFYENICLPSWNQIQHFTVAPSRTTFSTSISNARFFLPNSLNRIVKNYKSIIGASDITVNSESKKKPSLKQHIPSLRAISQNAYRFTKSTRTTVPINQKSTSYYVDHDHKRNTNNGSKKGCGNNNNINDDQDNRNDDDDDDDDDGDDIYSDNEYEDNDTSLISSNDEKPISAKKYIAYGVAGSLLTPKRTIKNVAIRPDPVTTHRNFQYAKTPLAKITSTASTSLATITIPSVNNIITRAAINDNTITTTITTIANATATITTTTTTTVTPALKFIPIPINILIPEWNTTMKDSELSNQNHNYILNIGIIEQNPNNQQMIHNEMIEELKCFHYFANKFVCFK